MANTFNVLIDFLTDLNDFFKIQYASYKAPGSLENK